MQRPVDIAVIGSGISGLGAAWLLSQTHKVTLFEREPRAGGHSNTASVPAAAAATRQPLPVDTGFIVYNTASYPNLIALFAHLAVPTATASMSFAVSLDRGRYEYSGSGLAGMFGQPSNLLNPAHLRMVADIFRFFRLARALISQAPIPGPTLGEFLSAHRFSDAFISRHILPMAAAIWSTPSAEVMAFPAVSFARFFAHHGLLQATGQPEWRTVEGGSQVYVAKIIDALQGRVRLGSPVAAITRDGAGTTITHANGRDTFDACVIATHADDALGLLTDPDTDERRLLGAFRYKPNRAVLHTDQSFMPARRRLWSSWNYLGAGPAHDRSLALTYWMNSLQPLGAARDIFVTLNPDRAIAPGAEIAAYDYSHPLFNQTAISAQRELWSLQGRRRTWFCGSYFGYGFHEDGLQSGLAAAEDIGGVRRPWTVAGESDRLTITQRTLPPPLADTREAAL